MAILADAVGLIVGVCVLYVFVRSVILTLVPIIGVGGMILLFKAFH